MVFSLRPSNKQNVSPQNGKQNISLEGEISLGQKQGKRGAGSFFLHFRGLIHDEFIPERLLLTENFNIEILRRL